MPFIKKTHRSWLALVLTALLTFCVRGVAYAQAAPDAERDAVVLAVKQAFEAGDHTGISSLFGSSVELQLPNVSGIFSKKQSDMIVGQFLASHAGLVYELDHEEVADSSTLTLGRATKDGEAFRVCILFQQSAGTQQIKQLRIETLK